MSRRSRNSEEIVVAKADLIEAVREEAALLQVGQLPDAIVDTGQAFGDLRCDLLEDRGAQQEVAGFIGLLVEHLLRQEVEQIAVLGGGDGVDELPALLRRWPLPERYLHQLQRSGPALGAALELGDLRRLERIVVDVAKQLGDFGFGESQRIGLELGVAAMRLEAGELEPRFDARGEHESAGRRRVPQDLVPETAHLGDGVDVLPVIDDEGARFRQPFVHLCQEVGRHPRARRTGTTHLLEH